MRWTRNVIVVMVMTLSVAGCNYNGINDFALPGTEGSGTGSYEVKIQMENVGNLVPNNPVRLGDVNVGVIRKVELDGWRPLVTIRLNPEVRLPANATARVGQVSLLGAKYIEIAQPNGEPPAGQLTPGSTIPLAHTGKYPETEDTLAAVATLLNGGGLQQLRTITYELNKALDGRAPQFRDLLHQLNTLITGLDAQKGDIVRAIDGIDRLGSRLANQDAVIRGALDDLPPALATLERERGPLVNSLDQLGRFGETFDDVVQRSAATLATNVSNLTPAVQKIADAGGDLVKALDLLPTLVFPVSRVADLFRGDYVNFWLTLDLSLGQLDKTYLTGTPLQGTLGAVEKTLASTAQTGRQLVNPLLPPGSGLPGAPPLQPAEDRGIAPTAPAPVPPTGSVEPAPAHTDEPTPEQEKPVPGRSDGILGRILGRG